MKKKTASTATTPSTAAPDTATPARMLFKVLDTNGRSTHRSMEWNLPTLDPDGSGQHIPGEWHEVDGEIVLCEWGLHLTYDPKHWWARLPGLRCWQLPERGRAARWTGGA